LHHAKSLAQSGFHFMGKVRQLMALAQRRQFYIRLGATFAAITGIASAILGIVGWQLGLIEALLLAFGVLLVSGIANFRLLIAPQVVVDDILAQDIDDSRPTRIHCPVDLKLASKAISLARDCFAASVSIEPSAYEQLRVKNPYILGCLTDHDGEFLGYFDAIPIREEFARPFLQGFVTEAQITHEDVLAPKELASCRYLFIAGIAVCDPETHAGRRNASILVWALLKYLERFYRSAKPLAFAVAATKSGDDLLRRFKLPLQGDAASRADKYKLYSIQITSEEIARRLACLPDWSKLCVLDWQPESRAHKSGKKTRRPRLPDAGAWDLLPTTAPVQSN
jgi:hypothetical protein